jgi:hypothetical protein
MELLNLNLNQTPSPVWSLNQVCSGSKLDFGNTTKATQHINDLAYLSVGINTTMQAIKPAQFDALTKL